MNEESTQESWLSPGDMSLDSALADLNAGACLRYALHQSFKYQYARPVRHLEQTLVVIPPLRHGAQHRRFSQLSISGAGGRATWSRDVFANSVARIRVPEVAESIEFQVTAMHERSGQGPVTLSAEASNDLLFLQPTDLTASDEALATAAHQAVGSTSSVREAAERLCALVHSSIQYQKDVTSVATTASQAFGIGAGVCQDHAHVMIAMCKAVSIPVRYVSGHLLGEGSTHAWVEVLVPDPQSGDRVHALPLDPSRGQQPDSSYVTVAVGRDYPDVAPASGTYTGSVQGQLTSKARLLVSLVEAT